MSNLPFPSFIFLLSKQLRKKIDEKLLRELYEKFMLQDERCVMCDDDFASGSFEFSYLWLNTTGSFEFSYLRFLKALESA